MNGDLSRAAFDPTRYTRVVAQQGRAQLDSDWNEQQAIIDYRLRTIATDVFGYTGASGATGIAVVPAARPGFGLHVHGGGTFDGVSSLVDWIASEWSGGDDPFAIGAWIAPAAAHNAGGTFGTIVACRGAYAIAVAADLRVVFTRAETAASGEAETRTLQSRAPLRTDGFSFVTCTFTGDALEIWIDGVLDARGFARPGPWLESPLRIGAGFGAGDAPSDCCAGTIEEVFVRRGRMLAHDVAAAFLHHAGEHGARWVFDASMDTAIEAAPPRLCAGPGRAYVDGRLCENPSHTDVETPAHGDWIAYLDVWERYVSAFEDPALREPALNGTDTTGRVRTVAQVRTARAGDGVTAVARDARDAGQISVELGREPDDNTLYRFQVHAPASATGGAADAVTVTLDEAQPPRESGLRTLRVAGAEVPWESGQFLLPAGGDAASVLRVVSRDDDGRTFTVAGVQPDTPRSPAVVAVAGVLWSSENANVVFALEAGPDAPADASASDASESTPIVLEDEANRAGLLTIDGFVVLTDDAGIAAGRPGFLTTITSVSTEHIGLADVVVAGRVPELGPGATLRLWDGVIPAVANDAGHEAGDLVVRFTGGGAYRTGDVWFATVRPNAPNALDWPLDAAGKPAFVPPAGIEHVYGELANVFVDEDGPRVEQDLRHVIRSMHDLSLEAQREREHERIIERALGEALERERELRERERLDHERLERELHELREHERHEREHHEREHRELEHHEREYRERHHHEHHDHYDQHDHHGHHDHRGHHGHHEHDEFGAYDEHETEHELVLARTPPHGYAPTGAVVDAVVEHPVWRAVAHVPDSGPADAVAIDGSIYVLFALTGSLVRLEPNHPDRSWIACAPYGRARRGYAVVAADGRLFLIGGYDARGNPSALVDAYDPRTDSWTEGWSAMRVARARPIAAGTGGAFVVCGGIRSTWFGLRYATQTAELFDAADERWRTLEPMPFRRYGAAAACAGGSLYVAGGALATGVLERVKRTARIDRMTLRDGRWTAHAPLHEVRFGAHAVAVREEEILVLGGAAGESGARAERVSTHNDDVRRLAWPGRGDAGVAAAGGVVYVVAGTRDGNQLSDAHACTLIDRMHVYRRRPERKET